MGRCLVGSAVIPCQLPKESFSDITATSQKVTKVYMALHCHSEVTFSTWLTFLSASLVIKSVQPVKKVMYSYIYHVPEFLPACKNHIRLTMQQCNPFEYIITPRLYTL